MKRMRIGRGITRILEYILGSQRDGKYGRTVKKYER